MTTVRGWGPLPDLVCDAGGEQAFARILKRHDLPASVSQFPERRIPLVKMVRVFEASAQALGIDEFGIRVGEKTSPEYYGDWPAFAYSAETLGEALSRLCRTIWAHENGSDMFVSQREHHVVWSYSTGLVNKETVRQFSDHLLTPMISFVRNYLGANWLPEWIELDYPKPAVTQRIDRNFDTRKQYGQPYSGIAISKGDLAAGHVPGTELPRPLTSLDLLKHRRPRGYFPLEVYLEAVELCLLDGKTDVESTAQLLDQGVRTLQRRLHHSGMSFRDLLQQARNRRASALLVETDHPVKSIAAELGYSEADNFTRAFQKWNDVSPSEFRRARNKAH